MRQYKIIKTDLGWAIYRKREIGKLIILQYLNGKGTRTTSKSYSRTFYNREDAVSALVIMKTKGENGPIE